MALYAGLSPKDALAKWYAIRQKPAATLTAEERADIAQGMVGLQQENPQAWSAVANGLDAQGNVAPYKGGSTVSVFDPNTGTYSNKRLPTWIENPESKLILAAAAGLGGVAAAPAIAGAFGGGGASAGSASGAYGPLAGGYGAATTAADVPAALAAGGAGSAAAASTPAWLKAVIAGGQLAGDYASGRAKGRAEEAGYVNNANRDLISLYNAQLAANNAENNFNLSNAGQENNYGLSSAGMANNFNLANTSAENNYGLTSANMANNYGLNAARLGIDVGQLDLAQKDFALAAPGRRANNAVRGDILANAQDVVINGPSTIPKTTISGGLRPSMFSGNTRELGGLLSSQALAQQKAGDKFAPLPTIPGYQAPPGYKSATYTAPPAYRAPVYKPGPAVPTLGAQPSANGLDAGLNWAGIAGAGADFLSKYGKFFGL